MSQKSKSTLRLKEPVKVRTRRLADGCRSVYLDIYHDGSRRYEFLRLYLLPETDDASRLRNEHTLRAVEAIKARRVIDLANGKASIGGSSRRTTLVEWLEEFFLRQQRRGIRNLRPLRAVINAVRAFSGKIRLAQLDRQWARDFTDWLRTAYRYHPGAVNHSADIRHHPRGRGIRPGTVATYISRLSIALNAAVRTERLEENPFRLLDVSERVHAPESPRRFLTAEEINRLIVTPCRSPLVKQAYLFSCFCGLRLSDVRRLRRDDIRLCGGMPMLSLVMKKTSTPIYLPLSRRALEWLPEAAAGERPFAALPTASTVNKILRQWSADAGIAKHVTFHTSRHTFGTLLMTLGADLYTVSKLMGHSDVRTTRIYARIVDSRKAEAIALIDRLLNS